jgi:hypothetical protein
LPKRDFTDCFRPVALFCAAAAYIAMGGASAEAACGDYVAIAGGHAGHFAAGTPTADDRLPAADALRRRGNDLSDLATPQPCRGPNCGRRAPSFPQPTPTVSSTAPDQWAFLSDGSPVLQNSARCCPSESAVLLASGFRRLPEHPPKR